MTRNQKILATSLIIVAIILGSVPTFLILEYGEKWLPILNLKLNPLQTSRQIPFGIVVTDGGTTTTKIPELTEQEKDVLTGNLGVLFRAHTSNLAYYFKYLTVVESNTKQGAYNFMIIFSNELPELIFEKNVKKIVWAGQRINFDIIHGHMLLALNGVLQFRNQENLNIQVFYSNSLQPKTIREPPNPKKTLPSEEL
ncbi:MAG: hypothetical protein AAB784_03125 [Patescibacteria group bacterium]